MSPIRAPLMNEPLPLPHLADKPKGTIIAMVPEKRHSKWKSFPGVAEDIPRGPFRTARDWLLANLTIVDKLLVRDFQNYDHETLRQARYALFAAAEIRDLLPKAFPPLDESNREANVISLALLSEKDIMVDDAGNLLAVLNWDHASVLPTWKACQPPWLLSDCLRNIRPILDAYHPDPREEWDEGDLRWEDTRDHHGLPSLYLDHLKQYEVTRLHDVFMEAMGRLQPEWIRLAKGGLALDFEDAIDILEILDADVTLPGRVVSWLGNMDVTDGRVSNRERLRPEAESRKRDEDMLDSDPVLMQVSLEDWRRAPG